MALLKKTRSLPWESKQGTTDILHPEFLSARLKRKARGLADVHAKAKKSKQPHHKLSNRSKPVKNMWQRRSFFNYFEPATCDDLAKDLAFYGFPDHLSDPFLYYSSTSAKETKVYITNQAVKDVIEQNLREEDSPVNLFHAGCKVFERSRKAQTSVKFSIKRENRLMPAMGERRTAEMPPEDVRKLLEAHEAKTSLEISELSQKSVDRLKEISDVGPIKVTCGDLVLLGHLGNVKVMLDVDKTSLYHAQLMLGDVKLC